MTTLPRPLVLLAAIACAAAVLPMPAAQAQKPDRPPTPEALMVEARLADLEADIGRLMQRRVDESVGPLRELELRIDVRIVARWLMSQAAAGGPGGERQTAGWIHANDLLAAALLAEQEIDAKNRAAPPNAPAVRALRDLTFKLPAEPKGVEDLDNAARVAGAALLAVFGGDAASVKLPAMRPPPPPRESAGPSNVPRSVEELAARARELNVSVSLRAQLLAAAGAAVAAARDPKQSKDAEPMRAVLEDAVTLAEGLQLNTAVEREDRVKMESQVAQGLAMFLDPRTRPLGQKRVAALGQYRQMLSRLTGMKIAPDLMKRFAPTLLAARRDPEQGAQLMASIELFLQQDARLAALPPGAGELTGPYAKAAEEARRRATSARETFVDAASSTSSFRNPQVLRGRAEAMRRALDARAAIVQTPDALKAINAYRPKPFGGIDKRIQTALTAWSGDASSDGDRDAATLFLTQLARLSEFAAEASGPASKPAGGADAVAAYTGDRLDSFLARRKAVAADAINSTAAGHALDATLLAPLETARTLLASLELAGRAERAVGKADVLRRWVDWGVDGEQLVAVLTPYREASAGAFEGYVDSDARLMRKWDEQWRRYQPLLALLARVGERADACEPLPPGRTGAVAKLFTPIADQPYAVERSARIALDAWQHHNESDNPKSADAALDTLAARLPR